MKIPRLSVDNFQFTLMVFILAIIFGVNAYISIPRTENPTIFIPGATVLVVYPGASPVDLEQLIASPIEESINELNDIQKINTRILDGVVAITVEFDYKTNPDDKFDEVVQKVNSIKNELPKDIMHMEMWQFSSSDVAMLQYALVSKTEEYSVLEEKAERLKKLIERLEGVKKVELVACPEQEVRISPDFEKMAVLNFSTEQLANAILSNNANIPGGTINLSGKTFGIKTSGAYQNLEEIRNTVVGNHLGKLIFLRDIAEVDFAYKDQNYFARFNGEKAIFVIVKQKPDLNIFHIMERISPKVEEFRNELDSDIRLECVFDQSSIVENRIDLFTSNLLQGIFLVGLVIFLALGFKSSLIVIIAIPLSILIGIGIVNEYGLGLQQITIAALVVALGLLVDNSIVMVENINRFLDMGYKPREAAIKGASEIAWPIVSATVTTVLAFVPIWLMPDKAGDFIKGLPVTIIATLGVSLVVALTLTPLIAAKFYKGHKTADEAKKKSKNRKGFGKILKRFIEGPYRKTLIFALKRKTVTIASAFLLLIGSVLFGILKLDVSFFPAAETPQLMIRVNLPEGSGLDATAKVVDYVESVLDTIPEIKHYATNIGHGNPRIYYNVFGKSYTKNFADIYVQTHSYDPSSFKPFIKRLRDVFRNFPGAKIHVKEFEQGIPSDAPIMVYISGENVDTLRVYANMVEEMLENSPGAINIENQLSRKRTDVLININKEKANLLGVPVHEIDKAVRVAAAGSGISEFRDAEGNDYEIVVRMPYEKEISISDFDKIYIKSLTGKMIPLQQLAKIEFKEAPGVITRYNMERTAIVTSDVEIGYILDDITNPINERLSKIDFPRGYSYRFGGELEGREEAFGGMENALLIAIIAIFAVLVLQFRSFMQPLIIFIAFPLGGIGMVWGLYLSGNSFSFTAFVGFISLVGIVINNSIILIDYTNKLIAEGKPLDEAVRMSGETRFTPILLTTLTTIGGLIPLTLQGGDLWAPMGWTIIGGLMVSTVLTLIIVPVLYKIFTKTKTINQS
ncbi:MAG: efflux RND transporter permease subunit [Bacteroidales bacterium]|nr:efflux RND transporter permease subunit [Bacteroidales bacterium]